MAAPAPKTKLRKLRDDFTYYAPQMLRIRTKEGQLVPLQLNAMQQKIDETIEQQRAAGKPVRLIILKYRQGGASTYTEGRIFHSTTMRPMTNSTIVAHEDDASTNLFNMSKLFYDELPAPMRPMRKASNAKELVFENPTHSPDEKQANPGLRSRIKIATARNVDAGRSATIHNLHASEVAFWPDAEVSMRSLLQAVPNTPNTLVCLESTANGVGGYFYEQWQRAKKGESDFIPLFFAWFEEPGYEMDVPADFRPTVEERELQKSYPAITDRKLVWRRWCIANNCGGELDTFRQEYPSNDIEAFLVSGRPRFDSAALQAYRLQCVPGERGYLERLDGRITFMPDAKGYIEVWRRPTKRGEYFIGADVAKGLETGDYSAAPVVDGNDNVVALWHGHIDPDLYADELDMLGTWYNEALIVPEENNHGLTVISRLKQTYSNIYKRTIVDKTTDEEKQELGFDTKEQNKRMIIDHLASQIREKQLGIKSELIISECTTYVRDAKGATNAQSGCFDDTVMGLALALHGKLLYGGSVGSIVGAQTESADNENGYVVQRDGSRKHASEVADEARRRRNDGTSGDDDAAWFKSMGW